MKWRETPDGDCGPEIQMLRLLTTSSHSQPPPHTQEMARQPAFIRHPGGQYPKQGRKGVNIVLEMYKEQTRDSRAWPLKGSSEDSQGGKKMAGSHTAPQKHPSGTPSSSPDLRTRLFPLGPHSSFSSEACVVLVMPPAMAPHLVCE